MSLNYNSTDPEHIKARHNVVPPNINDVNQLVWALIELQEKGHLMNCDAEIFQRLIYDYENKSHFYTVTGGWEGVEHLKAAYKDLIDK